MKIIYVHGIAQEHKDPDELREQWDLALAKGLITADAALPDTATTVLAYYGNTLFEKTAEIDAADAAGLLKRGQAGDGEAEAAEFYAEMLTDMAKVAEGVNERPDRREWNASAARCAKLAVCFGARSPPEQGRCSGKLDTRHVYA